MARPPGYQWQPLGLEADPIPGDTQALAQEAAHLMSTARTLAAQVSAMQRIAADNTEVGQHAVSIRSNARKVAGSLQVVATRYARVSAALSAWIPELEYAQRLSIQALNQAEAPYATVTRTVPLPSGPNLTAAQKDEISAHNASVQRAQAQLDDAKVVLARAIATRDVQGEYTAAKISQASNDALTDHSSFLGMLTGWADNAFGDLEHAVGDAAKVLKDIALVLEVVAAVLALAALAFTGVGLLLELAFVFTASALLIRTLLAVTGNGSWTDVAMDAAALLTLGVGGGFSGLGGLVGRAGKTIDSAVEVGDQLVTAERATSLSGRAAAAVGRAADFIESARLIPDALAKPLVVLARNLDDFNEGMRPLASVAVKDAEETSAWARIFAGGEQPAKYAVQMRMLLERFPDSPEIAQLGAKFARQLTEIRAVVGTGSAFALAPPVASGLQFYDPTGQPRQLFHFAPWEKLEDATTTGTIPRSELNFVFERATSSVW